MSKTSVDRLFIAAVVAVLAGWIIGIGATVMAIAGGAGGLVLASWARDLLWALRPPMFNHAGFRLALDSQVLLFAVGISLATGVLFGLAPALRATKSDLATDLKERASGRAGFHQLWHPRAVLVMAQVALSLVALIGAGLWLADTMAAMRKSQDCVMQGRRNCAPIDVPRDRF